MPITTPVITSNGSGDTATINLNEGTLFVTKVTATDPDAGAKLTFKIITDLTNGPDIGDFSIDANTGDITFKFAPDFEAAADSNKDNIYKIKVQVSDGDLVDTQIITINIADVLAANLTGTTGDDVFSTTAVSALFRTTSENDTIDAGDGNDSINGGLGADTMTGGDGDDTYFVDNTGDVVIEGMNVGSGTDKVFSSVSFAMGLEDGVDNLELTGTANINGTGNWLNNIITGNSGANILNGHTGADTMIGGSGNDVYITDGGDTITEALNAGTDRVESSVTFTLGANLEHLTLTGTANRSGNGNELRNFLIGNSGNNALNGLGGDDVIDGGAGDDIMAGGAGSDTYTVDSADDTITEVKGEGLDTVQSSVDYTLSAHVDRLILTGETGTESLNGTGNGQDNTLTGNAGENTLTGNGGNDTLDGKAGADAMTGGDGNDRYIVDNTGDVVTEATSDATTGRSDEVVANLNNYTLAAEVENLTLGTGAITADGNELNNKITGNSSNNFIDGGSGNDRIDGGLGNDEMTGGAGNDTFTVGQVGDSIIEAAGGGTDTVLTNLTYTLGENVENLKLGGFAAVSGTGNAENNAITGNSLVNTLSGLGGDDTLDGGRGNDTMIGGDGDDTYKVDSLTDTVTEASGSTAGAADKVIVKIDGYTLAANVENLDIAGTADIDGNGNELSNIINGNSGFNFINAGAGDDTVNGRNGADNITGGAGLDTLTGGSQSDTFVWAALADSGTTAGTADVITDFAKGDKIDLRGIDALSSTTSVDEAFVLNNSFTEGQIRITYSNAGATALVELNNDSDSAVEMAIVVNLTKDAFGNFITLAQSDFLA